MSGQMVDDTKEIGKKITWMESAPTLGKMAENTKDST